MREPVHHRSKPGADVAHRRVHPELVLSCKRRRSGSAEERLSCHRDAPGGETWTSSRVLKVEISIQVRLDRLVPQMNPIIDYMLQRTQVCAVHLHLSCCMDVLNSQ